MFCKFECFVFVILSCTNKDYFSLYFTCSTLCVWEKLSTSHHLYLLYLVGRPWHLLRTPPPEGTFVPPPPPGLSSAAAVRRFTFGGARRTDSRRLSSPSVRTWQGNTNRGLQTASFVKPSKVSAAFLTETVFACFSHILIHVCCGKNFWVDQYGLLFENFHWGFWTYFSVSG